MKPAGIAKRMRKTADWYGAAESMETVVCSKCGQRFAIHPGLKAHDAGLAVKQAAWVEEQLVWDHIQERRHHGSIDLPDFQ